MAANSAIPEGCLPIYTVDSFTSKPFAGNPAAVCLEDSSMKLTDETRQNIAKEMNISETAFLQMTSPNDTFKTGNRFKLRWFTPTDEVPLCGHATLATSAVLFECVKNDNREIIYETMSGELTAQRAGNNISLNLPLNPPQPVEDRDSVKDLLEVFVPDPDNSLVDVQYSSTTKFLLLGLKDTYTMSFLESLQPQFSQLVRDENKFSSQISLVFITLYTGDKEKYDFVSRVFGPWIGIPEDPVTGAAHTVLSPYWAKHLGKTNFFARQCSARGGELYLTVRDDGRLDVAGPACLVLSGFIRVQ